MSSIDITRFARDYAASTVSFSPTALATAINLESRGALAGFLKLLLIVIERFEARHPPAR